MIFQYNFTPKNSLEFGTQKVIFRLDQTGVEITFIRDRLENFARKLQRKEKKSTPGENSEQM